MKPYIKKRLKQLFSNTKVDCIIISHLEPMSDKNFFCFTGITNASFHYGTAVLFPKRIHLIVAAMEAEEARKTKYPFTILSPTAFANVLKNVASIGIDATKMSAQFAKRIKRYGRVKDISKTIEQARLIKSADEIQSMRKACDIVSQVADKIQGWMRVGMTELQLAAKIEYEMKVLGSANPAFETIVAFGKNSADPHHQTDSTSLKKHQFVLCDFGATINNLRSDLTRTFIFGTPTRKQKALYDLVKTVQVKAISALQHHSVYKLAEIAIQDINAGVKKLKLKGGMMHSLGHGLGFDVHEDRMINMSKTTLEPGQVTTIEPGAYIPGFGGVRIEDDILITKSGIEILTTAKK
jgi:Xaa-Pro dipeptidase